MTKKRSMTRKRRAQTAAEACAWSEAAGERPGAPVVGFRRGELTARHLQYLFANGWLTRVWDEANAALGVGSSWRKWSDETEWRPCSTNPTPEKKAG
jgi:hypothetical protein